MDQQDYLLKDQNCSGDEASATLYAAMVGTSVGDNLTVFTDFQNYIYSQQFL